MEAPNRMMRTTIAVLAASTTLAAAAHAQLALSYQPDAEAPGVIEEAVAAETDGRHAKLTLIWDNDSRPYQLVNQSDRDYTNGLELSLSFGREPEGTTLDKILRWVPAAGFDIQRTSFGISIGQEIYTPADIGSPEIQTGDHPFAGFAYVAFDFQRADYDVIENFRVRLGATGDLSGARAAQEFVHAVLPNQIDPEGWDNQVDEQFAGELDYRRVWRTFAEPIGGSSWSYQFLPEAGVRLGNLKVDARVGATARIGFNLPDDFGPARKWGVIDHGAAGVGDQSLYLFTRVGGEYVAHDLLIDGNTDATDSQADIMPLVGQISAGVRYRYHGFEVGWQYTAESRRYREQQRGHSYGSWIIGWAFDF